MNESDEAGRLRAGHGAHRKEDRKDASVLPACADFAALTDDVRNPCGRVTCQVTVVQASIGLGHQHTDVLTQNLVGAIAEQAFGSSIERLDTTGMVNQNDAVDSGVQKGLESL